MSHFSSEPEADADTLDDDELLEAYFSLDKPASGKQPVVVPDWPPRRGSSVSISIDPDIATWFKAHHRDWRGEINFVLRAWITAQHATGQPAG